MADDSKSGRNLPKSSRRTDARYESKTGRNPREGKGLTPSDPKKRKLSSRSKKTDDKYEKQTGRTPRTH